MDPTGHAAIAAYLRRSIVEDRDLRANLAGGAGAVLARTTDSREPVGAPFLMASEAEARVYARVGFRPIGTVLHISREAPRDPT